MLYHYSILPLSEYEMEARIADIVAQAKGPSHLFPLFMMTLVPEGDPVWDKAGELSAIYAKYREALAAQGVESGVLIQASLGHGYTIKPSPFSKYARLIDGGEEPVYCPMDEDFLAHFAEVCRTVAKARPRAIMLDDDFRLMMRPGLGCACPRHMAEFNRRAGTDMTREELCAHLRSHPKTDRLARIFEETQRDSMVHAAEVFRAAIDEIDPTIQGINCTSGDICESVLYTAPAFAGKGNPTMVRVGNGVYYPNTNRRFSHCMRGAAVCGGKLKKHGIDVVLAETDTLPFNRYAKSSRYLHAQYTASILEGLKGAKHWLTRLWTYEPQSGEAYRKILAKHAGLYERLSALSEEVQWMGANSYFVEQEDFDFRAGYADPLSKHWAVDIFERMGLPFYFSDTVGDVNLLEGKNIIDDLTDEQIDALFCKSVIADGEAARALCTRGFEKYLGVTAHPWELGLISMECFGGNAELRCEAQPAPYELRIKDEKTAILTENMRWVGTHDAKMLAPASTCLERENGRITAVFCGAVASRFSFERSFAYLNESRKAQLIDLLSKAGALPVYLEGDGEVCLRAGKIKDGRLLVALYPLGSDPVETPVLYLENAPAHITHLLPDGEEEALSFSALGNGRYRLSCELEIMKPEILLIQ